MSNRLNSPSNVVKSPQRRNSCSSSDQSTLSASFSCERESSFQSNILPRRNNKKKDINIEENFFFNANDNNINKNIQTPRNTPTKPKSPTTNRSSKNIINCNNKEIITKGVQTPRNTPTKLKSPTTKNNSNIVNRIDKNKDDVKKSVQTPINTPTKTKSPTANNSFNFGSSSNAILSTSGRFNNMIAALAATTASALSPCAHSSLASSVENKTLSYFGITAIQSFILIIFMPLVLIYLAKACNHLSCDLIEDTINLAYPYLYYALMEEITEEIFIFKTFPYALIGVLCWIIFNLLIYLLPFGKIVDATTLLYRSRAVNINNKGPDEYRLNGSIAFVISHLLFFIAYFFSTQEESYYKGNEISIKDKKKDFSYHFNIFIIVDYFFELVLASVLVTFFFSVLLFIASFWSKSSNSRVHSNNLSGSQAQLRRGQHVISPLSEICGTISNKITNHILDFWSGREFNHRILFNLFDLKLIFRHRYPYITWSILNWLYTLKAYDEGTSCLGLYAITITETIYLFFVISQEKVTFFSNRMNKMVEGFGFSACFLSFSWIPFIYSIKTRFLYFHPQFHTLRYNLSCYFVFFIGYVLSTHSSAVRKSYRDYIVFRSSNSGNTSFRNNTKSEKGRTLSYINDSISSNNIICPSLSYLKTNNREGLIITSYWCICRHPSYLGEWLMAFSLSMLTGTSFLAPYIYQFSVATLLLYRLFRIEYEMRIKFGAFDWNMYCSCVPYKILPYIY